MNQPFHLTASGQRAFQRWRDAQSTDPNDIPLVEEVVTFIADYGWPPRVTGTPNWLCFQNSGPDPEDREHWIVARTASLWVIIRPYIASCEFEFVTAISPTADQIEAAEFLTEPPEQDA